jgi:hypothetical protein
MDKEFQRLLRKIGLKDGAIPPILDYYESKDVESLTKKISSIPAFQGISSPMRMNEKGYVPDFTSRYFTEDFPFGMRYIVETAVNCGVNLPLINKVYSWGRSIIDNKL